MVFGTKKIFAIEAILTQGQDYVLIQFCYWIKNEMIGDLEQLVLLTSAIGNFTEIVNTMGKKNFLTNENNARKLTDEIIYSEILYTLSSDTSVPSINFSINQAQTENMDGYYLFLIETKSYEWILCKDDIDNKYYDVKIPKSQFYNQIKSLLDWINKSTVLVLRSEHQQ